jgi:tyrosyl-tRNA synthetase
MSILQELDWRGLVADCTDRIELAKRTTSGPITLYCGFDPTADSLHVGNLVPLLALRRFQLLGHHPIALAGGATGSIGDPSGKTQERQLLTQEVLDANIARVKEQLKRLLDFEAKTNPARLVDNASWTAKVSYLDFLRDIGKHFSVNQMVAKESVRARMEDREVGISYTEFSYMLLQAFDFYVLCRDQNCELQIGGSDQWGNITAGMDLTRKKLGKTVYGLTLPLITNADGSKFGKTVAGAVWLDANKTSVEDFYQFWIRTDDRDVIRYLKFFTLLSREEIEELERQHTAKPESRTAHEALARELRNLIHPSATGVAERASKILFGKLSDEYTLEDWEFLAKHSHSIEVEKSKLVGMLLIELLVLAGLSSSKGQARKDIEGRGISINNNPPLPNYDYHIQPGDLRLGKYLRLRKGKKNYVVVTAK